VFLIVRCTGQGMQYAGYQGKGRMPKKTKIFDMAQYSCFL
jgi:hypothetical protein